MWLAFGYVLATDLARVIAIHDCDIRDYDRELLARLCFPVANRNMNYEFAKGYYARVTERLYGRVTRLFMTPLLRAMKSVLGPNPLLEFLDSFRFPLAGECAMTIELARSIRIPSDWGLEVGLLAEVFRNCALKRVCQVELTENYDHKHRDLSESTLDGPAAHGRGHRRLADPQPGELRHRVRRRLPEHAHGGLRAHGAGRGGAGTATTPTLNGVRFDRHEEEMAVEVFSRSLRRAGLDFVRDPMGAPQIPNWNRVTSALPRFLQDLREAVDADSR